MESITAILVDDEPKALSVLELKLNKIFPQILIIGKYTNPEEAIVHINNQSPDVLFLDINMPNYTGFELLQHLNIPAFELIFITAYDHYALEAIKKAAVGYVLKPVNDDELRQAVQLAMNHIHLKRNRVVEKKTWQKTKIALPFTNGFELKFPEEIIRCEGFDGYARIYLTNGEVVTSSYNIGYFNKVLVTHGFRMVHKSHLVNLNHIVKYLNEGTLVLSNHDHIPVSRIHKQDMVKLLKGNG
jgi:two-component system LytT family response regulator